MPRRRVTIASASGLHARPASLFTRAAAECGHDVSIGRVGEAGVAAASVLLVMSLGLQHGETVDLVADDAAADAALDALARLLATDLDAAP